MHISYSYDMSYVITFDIWEVRIMSYFWQILDFFFVLPGPGCRALCHPFKEKTKTFFPIESCKNSYLFSPPRKFHWRISRYKLVCLHLPQPPWTSQRDTTKKVVNDPLGQPKIFDSLKWRFVLFRLTLKDRQTELRTDVWVIRTDDVQTPYVNILIITRRERGLAAWINKWVSKIEESFLNVWPFSKKQEFQEPFITLLLSAGYHKFL